MKIDFKKEIKELYKASAKKVEFVKIPTLNYLVIEGKGDPNTSKEFHQAIEALYAVAYTLKFKVKKGSDGKQDYVVPPLETSWWVDDAELIDKPKSEWQWTNMIMQPSFVTKAMVQQAIVEVTEKKNPAAISKLQFQGKEGGEYAKTLHLGPFEKLPPTIEKLHNFILENNKKRNGKHHEIYLSDVRRANPENWKTILLQEIK